MRLPDSPMTPTEFEDTLANAERGLILTDNGATPLVQDALVDVAGASDRDRPGLVMRARMIFAHQSRPTPSGP